MIHILQGNDAFVKRKWKTMFNCKIKTDKVSLWRFNSEDLLFHNKQVYVLEEESVKVKLLKLHYDDVLMRHFSVKRTLKLLTQKYY